MEKQKKFTALSDAEKTLCEDIQKAVKGGLPFRGMGNHGKNADEKKLNVVAERFAQYMKTDIAEYINSL